MISFNTLCLIIAAILILLGILIYNRNEKEVSNSVLVLWVSGFVFIFTPIFNNYDHRPRFKIDKKSAEKFFASKDSVAVDDSDDEEESRKKTNDSTQDSSTQYVVSTTPKPFRLQVGKHYKLTNIYIDDNMDIAFPFEGDLTVVDNSVCLFTGDSSGNIEDFEHYDLEGQTKLSSKYQYKLDKGYMNVAIKGNSICVVISYDGNTNIYTGLSTAYKNNTLKTN